MLRFQFSRLAVRKRLDSTASWNLLRKKVLRLPLSPQRGSVKEDV